MAASLPRRRLTPAQAIRLVRCLQRNNHKAKLSHYKRRDRLK
jgi:hypothetical protein